MAAIPRLKDLAVRLIEMERRLAKLERTSRLSSASIGEGGLTIRDGGAVKVIDGGQIIAYREDGTAAVYYGQLNIGGNKVGDGMWFIDSNGESIAFIGDRIDNGSQVEFFDEQSNQVFAIDGASGFGLKKPYLPTPMYRSDLASGYFNTTSGSFQIGYAGVVAFQQPYVYVQVAAVTAGDSGEVRVKLDGVVVGGGAQAFSGSTFLTFTVPVPQSFGSLGTLELEVRRTAGAGTGVGIRPSYVLGAGTP